MLYVRRLAYSKIIVIVFTTASLEGHCRYISTEAD